MYPVEINLPIHDASSVSISIVELLLFICNCGSNIAEYPDIIPKFTVSSNGPKAAKNYKT